MSLARDDVSMNYSIPASFARPARARRGLGLQLLAAAFFTVIHVQAADTSVEARLEAMEAQIKSLQSENQQLRRELGLDGKAGLTFAKPAGKEPVLTINGLVQAQAEFGDKGDSRFGTAADRFFLRRVRLGAAGRFLEDFDFKVEGEFANSLTGGTTAASAVLTDGFLNWNRFDWANVRIGQFKTPYGYEFLASDPKLFTPERSLGTDRLTLNRQIGVQVAGDVFDKRLSYAGGLFNGTGTNVSANDNDSFLYVGRVSGIPWQGRLLGQAARWSVGADGFTSVDNGVSVAGDFGLTGKTFSGQRKGVGLDTQFSLGGLDLWAEYLSVQFNPNDTLPARRFTSDAWYLQAAYFILPKTVQGVVRYETFDPNEKLAANETDTWTVGVNWFLKGDDLKLQLDYLFTDPAASADEQGKLILRSQVIF